MNSETPKAITCTVDAVSQSLPQRAKWNAAEIEFYTPAEVEQILRRLKRFRPELLPLVAIGAFAGLRQREIARLEWSDVRLEKGDLFVRVRMTGWKSSRLVPIQPNLAAWLTPYSKKKGNVCPFVRTPEAVCRMMKAEVVNLDGTKEPGIILKLNRLRHSFATYRLASTGNAFEVCSELGNPVPMGHISPIRQMTAKQAATYWAVFP
jgi:integrase